MSGKKDSLIKRKLDWCLLLVDLRKPLKEVAKILHFAAYDKPEPYGPRNWMGGNNEAFRYELRGAIERHTDAIDNGETHDPESKCRTRGHIICSHLFLLYFEIMDAIGSKQGNPCPHDSITETSALGYINQTYPWNEAPEWAMWGATDANGDMNWYDLEPDHDHEEWLRPRGNHEFFTNNGPCENWKKTLEARPK
jgi:hypothetical protein